MHIELDRFGLLFVLEVIVSHQVVDLIDDWGSRRAACWKGWDLKEQMKT